MADDLMKLYFSDDGSDTTDKPSKSVMDMYFKDDKDEAKSKRPVITIRPVAPPVSGLSQEDSDEANKDYFKGPVNVPQPSLMSKALRLPVDIGANIGGNILNNAYAGAKLASEGASEAFRGKPMPRMPSIDPATWEAGGILKGLAGSVAMPLSPITGLASSVNDLVTNVTGNPEAGSRAEFLSSFAVPVAKAGNVINAARPSNKALSDLVKTIGPDELPNVVSEMKRNPRLSVMDVNLPAKQIGQKLVVTEGTHQNQIDQFVKDRVAGSRSAVEEAYNDAMGAPVSVLQKVNELKKSIKEVGKKEIEPVVNSIGQVDPSKVIGNIDAKLKPGVNSVISMGEPLPLGDIEKSLSKIKSFLTDNKSIRTDPKSLHQLQSALRAKADDMLNSPSGQDRQIGHALMGVRNDIVTAIDEAGPKIKLADGTEVGAYKQGLSRYRDENQIQDAFNKGRLITSNRLKVLDDHPEFWDDWIKKASPEEVSAAREGARVAVDSQLRGLRRAVRQGTAIPQTEFNVEKLRSLFGKKEIDEMTAKLSDEARLADTNNKLLENSQTAMRLKANNIVDLPSPKDNNLKPFLAPLAELAVSGATGVPGASALVLAGQGTNKLIHKTKLELAKRKNNVLTELLTSQGQDRTNLIQQLSNAIPGPKQTMLQRSTNALQNLIGP